MVFMDRRPGFLEAENWKRNGLFQPRFMESIKDSDPRSLFSFPLPWTDIPTKICSLVCNTYLIENGIAQGDRLSMASSVELRLPLVDFRLVETIIGIRKTRPDHQLPAKALFNNAIQGVLPDWVMKKPKKGFTPPVREWSKQLLTHYGPLLRDGTLVDAGILEREASARLASGEAPDPGPIPMPIKALWLEIWNRQVLQ